MKKPLSKEGKLILLKYKISLSKQMSLTAKIIEIENHIHLLENNYDVLIEEEMKKYK